MTDPATEFRVLGPVQVRAGDDDVRVGPRERAVLARLVLDANRVVSVDRLIDAVWPADPPASARSQVAICVSRLRRSLGAAGTVIATAPPGYMARLGDESADWPRFNTLVARAKARAAAGERTAAVGLLREALSLWRGAPFEDLPGLRDDAARVHAARLDAIELCAELELQLGLYDRVLKELPVVVAEHPLRERARAQLMLAQYRAGRRADALRSYQEARRALVEQIGIEPGPELRALHEQILRDEPLLTHRVAEERVEVPSQLPRQPLPFAGRTAELSDVDNALAQPSGVAVVSGPGEIGKSALALHWAHANAAQFPDGRLYAELSDDTGRPVPVDRVLARFLTALGLAVPADHDERVDRYRTAVADRRLLVVLDGAVDAAQVRPLLPGGAGTRVLVTGRNSLDDLVVRDGAAQVNLAPLSTEESLGLLELLLGRSWVSDDPREAGRLVATAQGFPLPLRAAAARVGSDRRARGRLTSVSA